MDDILFKDILDRFNFTENDICALNPLILAYVGDAVYEVYVRTFLVHKNKVSVHKLHKLSIEYVKAKSQSDIIHRIMDKLTDDEKDIVRRGRNAKSGTIPKNADVTEYKYATGFESLIGYLYLKRDYSRLMYVLDMSIMTDSDRE